MGTLMGHVLPGSFFIAFSLWWIYSIAYRYYRSLYFRQGEGFRSSATYGSKCCGGRIPIEALCKILAASIGITGEAITGFENGHWAHWGNAQHITMFFFFGISGVVDVLYFYKVDLPADLDYAAAILAFVVEGLLFAYHLHGRSTMDVMIHTFLLHAVVACAVSAGFEARYRNNVVCAFARCFFTLVQGTWFYHIGFILYPPPGMSHWEEENHEQMMIVTMLFCWHFALASGTIFFVMLLTKIAVKRQAKQSGVTSSDSRVNFQYQKIGMDDLPVNGGMSRPLTANGTSLRQAFNESSEDEV